MSEKRFTFSTKWRWILFDNETEKFMDMEDCKDKLNEQSERIKSLEMELDLVANFKVWSRRKLEEENEQLKQEIIIYKKAFQEQVQRCSL